MSWRTFKLASEAGEELSCPIKVPNMEEKARRIVPTLEKGFLPQQTFMISFF